MLSNIDATSKGPTFVAKLIPSELASAKAELIVGYTNLFGQIVSFLIFAPVIVPVPIASGFKNVLVSIFAISKKKIISFNLFMDISSANYKKKIIIIISTKNPSRSKTTGGK